VYRKFLKRGFDIFFSSIGLLLLSPILVCFGVIIYLQDGGPVFFSHYRVGKNGQLFRFHKFRSMPLNMPLVESHEISKIRITPFGYFIRRTNIDELPQLINILKGEMSLVGPRPPIPIQTALIELRKQNGSLFIKPGLTGWAQVNAYDNMSVFEKAKYDGEYSQRFSFMFDAKIIIKTIFYLRKKPPVY
jgi:O-antigen biosynthesis protein WbqP